LIAHKKYIIPAVTKLADVSQRGGQRFIYRLFSISGLFCLCKPTTLLVLMDSADEGLI
jgi:hypothetical protein